MDILTDPEQATLSCQECRRRKIRCDRRLPSCFACMNTSFACVYPEGPLKPGPKPGSTRRSKKRRIEPQCHSLGAMNSGLQPTVAQYIPESNHMHSFTPAAAGKPQSLPIAPSSTRECRSVSPHAPSDPAAHSQSPGVSSLMSQGKHRRLSWLVHPNHEPTSSVSECVVDETPIELSPSVDLPSLPQMEAAVTRQVCDTLQTDGRDVHYLLDLYFENMLAFTLFTPQLFAAKIQIASPLETATLLAAMFSFSARFRTEKPESPGDETESRWQAMGPTSKDFYSIAKKHIDEQLLDLESPPPLLFLQAMVLTSFHDLIGSAEGKGWRAVGSLVRIAYELRLHLVDRNGGDASCDSPDLWSAKEERRRTWWAIWELDVFTSTVRRLPTAIDWNQNWTRLPVADEYWAQKTPKDSCYLVADPTARFKLLEVCGNRSAKAWFIVANSLMRTAYCLSKSQEYYWTPPGYDPPRPGLSDKQTLVPTVQSIHQILSNSVYCFSIALPRELRYRGQSLFSDAVSATKGTKQRDSDIYSIHLMLRLTDFMVNHCEVLRTVSGPTKLESSLSHPATNMEDQNSYDIGKLFAKNVYMAETVLSLIRNSGLDHISLVNPFLASTIWLATAVFLAYKYLGISSKSNQEHLLVDSNIGLLKAVFAQFVDWWGMSSILGSKLSELETELVSMRDSKGSGMGQQQDPSTGSIITRTDVPPPPGNSHQSQSPEAQQLNTTAQLELSANDCNALDLSTPFLTHDEVSLDPTYEPISGLFGGDFFYDIELQGLLDGMFATFRGQIP